MTVNKNNSKVIQCYTNNETHLEIKKVAKLRRLSVSKLCELVLVEYVKNYLEEYENEQLITSAELRKLRGY